MREGVLSPNHCFCTSELWAASVTVHAAGGFVQTEYKSKRTCRNQWVNHWWGKWVTWRPGIRQDRLQNPERSPTCAECHSCSVTGAPSHLTVTLGCTLLIPPTTIPQQTENEGNKPMEPGVWSQEAVSGIFLPSFALIKRLFLARVFYPAQKNPRAIPMSRVPGESDCQSRQDECIPVSAQRGPLTARRERSSTFRLINLNHIFHPSLWAPCVLEGDRQSQSNWVLCCCRLISFLSSMHLSELRMGQTQQAGASTVIDTRPHTRTFTPVPPYGSLSVFSERSVHSDTSRTWKSAETERVQLLMTRPEEDAVKQHIHIQRALTDRQHHSPRLRERGSEEQWLVFTLN